MTKPYFTYHFRDEPQFRSRAEREWVANYLSACRRNGRYLVARLAPGVYTVTMPGYDAVAVVARAGAPT